MLKFSVQDRTSLFESGERNAALAQKSVRGGVAMMMSQGVQFCLQMAGTVILAWLLTPGDYGIIGMVAIVTGFAQIFQDAGLSTATIQKDQITHRQISSLFWINVFVSVIVCACVLASAPVIGWFFGKPELIPVTAVLSLCFIMNGLSVQHRSLLQRQLRFGASGTILIASQLITLLVSILLAYLGWGYWALVAGSLAAAITSSLAAFILCPWIPGWIRKGTGVRKMLTFGGHITGNNIINYFSRNADNLLIGKFIGADALGLYAKAYSLFMLPISQIRGPMNTVALPVLSALKDQPERYIKYYQRFVDILASLTIPLMIYCACEADFLISLLGPQWLEAVPVFRILAIAAVIQPVYTTAFLVQVSHGYSKQYFIWGCVSAIVFISAFVCGLPYGISGVAAFYAVANYLLFIPTLLYCFHRTPVTVPLFLRTMLLPLGISLVAAGVSIAVTWFIESWIVKHVAFICLDAAIIFCAYFFRKSLRETIRLFAADLGIRFKRTDSSIKERTVTT